MFCSRELAEWAEVAGAAFTGLMVILLWRHARLFRRQAIGLERSITDARDKEKRELRAYIHITHFLAPQIDGEPSDPVRHVRNWQSLLNMLNGDVAPNPPDTLYLFKTENYGKTPAHDVRNWGDIRIAPYDNPDESIFVEPSNIENAPMSRSPMAPKGISVATFGFTKSISMEEIDMLMKGIFAIYIYGAILYTDAFDEPRKTTFRFIHRVSNLAKALTWILE